MYLQGIMTYGLRIEVNEAKHLENTTQLNELWMVCRWHGRAFKHGVAVPFFWSLAPCFLSLHDWVWFVVRDGS